MRRLYSGQAIGIALAATVLVACGSSTSIASHQSPSAETSSTTPSTSPSQQPTPTPSQAAVRLVIDDFTASQVRLARFDATDTAVVKGHYAGTVQDQVIVMNGKILDLLNRNGTVRKLGQLAMTPDWVGLGTVVINPQLTQWLYSTHDDVSTASIHLGTATSDKVIATLPSPDGNAYYQPFAWNPSGIYMVRQPIGIGGAGPFLEYHFQLAKFDMTTGQVADVSPFCIVYHVLDDGTLVCRQQNPVGRLEIRSPTGTSHVIQVSSGVNMGDYGDGSYIRVVVSPDGSRLVAGRNGSKTAVINYQMAIADLTSASATAFGPPDYLPDLWLPDGRVVAEHYCAYIGFGGGPCDASLDGVYFFSADGNTHTLFYKLAYGLLVAYV